MNSRALLISLMLVLLACSSTVRCDMKAAEDKAALLGQAFQTDVTEWRYQVGEVANGQDPKLDDSSWQQAHAKEFTWGQQPLAWLRARVTIPKEVDGISVVGSKVTFQCGCDDDGTIYINGVKVQDFHWDQGSAMLTERAEPGQTFDIAIRNTNGPGDGRLLLARLDYSVLDPIVQATNDYLAKFNYARDLVKGARNEDRARYEPCLVKSMDAVKAEAMSKDTDQYLASLKSATAELDPVNEIVRNVNIDLVGHAHIDMNWLWLWPETIDVCRNTFNSVSKLMDDFPAFKFSQSQPAVYAAMKESAPEVFANIQERVKRGQWDTRTATSWVEGDTNMSSGEAIVRSILYGKRFMKKEFGIESDVCWEPDTFGHVGTMPQILAKSGIKYYYFMRCDIGSPLFWWQSPDGSKVLAYCYGPYNKGLDAGVGVEAANFYRQSGVRDYMHVYGVGDHGGGPTREMLNTEQSLSTRTDFPKLHFSTPAEYFEAALKSKSDYRVWTGDLNTTFEGCYTSHADAKRWNRDAENLLPTAETFSVIAASSGVAYPRDDFENSWRKTCFNEFHDILCGTAIHGSYDYSGKLHEEAMAQGKAALGKSLNALAARINTTGKGSPIVVYNPLAWTRTDCVTVASPFSDYAAGVSVVDASGKTYPAQMVGGKLSFTARDVPAVGYKTFWATRSARPAPAAVKFSAGTMENQFYKVTIDPASGTIISVFDKINNRETLPAGAKSAVLQMRLQKDTSAWGLGSTVSKEDIAGKVRVWEVGPAKATLRIDSNYGESHITQFLSLYDGVPRIDIHAIADWQEYSGHGRLAPLLKQGFAVDAKDAKAFVDIPFGSIERSMNGSEVPAQKWVDISGPNGGLSVLNDCKYGLDIRDGVIWNSLMSSPADPDPRPDQGKREWTLSIYPHKGDWRAAATPRKGYELNEPLVAMPVSRHPGRLKPSESSVSVSAPNVIVTALKKAEDDDSLILRFYETDGRPCTATLRTALPVRSYVECDLMERPIGKARSISKGAFTVNVGKCEIKTYKLIR